MDLLHDLKNLAFAFLRSIASQCHFVIYLNVLVCTMLNIDSNHFNHSLSAQTQVPAPTHFIAILYARWIMDYGL